MLLFKLIRYGNSLFPLSDDLVDSQSLTVSGCFLRSTGRHQSIGNILHAKAFVVMPTSSFWIGCKGFRSKCGELRRWSVVDRHCEAAWHSNDQPRAATRTDRRTQGCGSRRGAHGRTGSNRGGGAHDRQRVGSVGGLIQWAVMRRQRSFNCSQTVACSSPTQRRPDGCGGSVCTSRL